MANDNPEMFRVDAFAVPQNLPVFRGFKYLFLFAEGVSLHGEFFLKVAYRKEWPDQTGDGYTASLFRPFLLLLLKTSLPAFVLILDKKPKVLFLFMLLGWYVLFKVYTPF